jgi:hypothetical protein
VAIGLLLTEKGIAFKEVAANEDSTEVEGAIITDSAVIAGALVTTADGTAYQVVGATADGFVSESAAVTEDGVVVVDVVALAADSSAAKGESES